MNYCTTSVVVPLKGRPAQPAEAGWLRYRSELINAARQALLDGWQPWELPEVVQAHARSHGVELPTEHAELLARAAL